MKNPKNPAETRDPALSYPAAHKHPEALASLEKGTLEKSCFSSLPAFGYSKSLSSPVCPFQSKPTAPRHDSCQKNTFEREQKTRVFTCNLLAANLFALYANSLPCCWPEPAGQQQELPPSMLRAAEAAPGHRDLSLSCLQRAPGAEGTGTRKHEDLATAPWILLHFATFFILLTQQKLAPPFCSWDPVNR